MKNGSGHEFPTPTGFTSVEGYSASLSDFYESPWIRQLAEDTHIVDFFLPLKGGAREGINVQQSNAETQETEKNLFQTVVPLQWQKFFDSKDVDDVIDGLIYGGLGLMKECPESLDKLTSAIRSHSLNRTFQGPAANSLPNKVMGGMNPKKRYECEQYSFNLIRQAEEAGADNIVDLGSGKGHLARTLSFQWAKPIITVESNELYISRAKQLDAQWMSERGGITNLPSFCGQHNRNPIFHVHSRVETAKQFSKLFTTEVFGDNSFDSGRSLVGGLHACGNLTNLAICSIVECPQVKAISVVGCCYNLLTNRQDGDSTPGFPLSHHMATKVKSLSMTSRMLASQAPSIWTKKARQSSFKRHFFRALLQRIIYDYKLATDNSRSPVVGKLPRRAYDDFGEYCFEAFKKLNFHLDNDLDLACQKQSILDVAQIYLQRYGKSYNQLCLLWSLMAVCTSTLTEAIITLDRYFYLVEKGIPKVKVSIIFDYTISPRNILVSAAK